MYQIFTANLLHIPKVMYISSCFWLHMIMYIFNINNKTWYCNRWIRPTTFRTLKKYLKWWRFMLAHLNKHIDLYYQKRNKVVDYKFNMLLTRANHLSWAPYGYRRSKFATITRSQCIQHMQYPQQGHILHHLAMTTTARLPHRVHFDTDSYDIMMDNWCSKSITNCLNCLTDFITPPKKSIMMIKWFNGATAHTKIGTAKWKIQCANQAIIPTALDTDSQTRQRHKMYHISWQHHSFLGECQIHLQIFRSTWKHAKKACIHARFSVFWTNHMQELHHMGQPWWLTFSWPRPHPDPLSRA